MRNVRLKPQVSIPILIFTLGLAITVVLTCLFLLTREDQLEARFAASTEQMRSVIEGRMTLYTNVLYGAQGLFAASEEVGEDEWEAYVNALDIPRNYQGISAMLFIRRVPEADLATLPFTVFPSAQKPEYFPITYVVNLFATSTSLGFDISSEAGRLSALREASTTGQPSATPVVQSATANPIPVFSIYVPVRAGGVSEGEPATGYVSATFRVKELFDGLAADPIFDRNVNVTITDPDGIILLDTGAVRSGAARESGLERSDIVVVGGREWRVDFNALTSYSLGSFASALPWIVLVFGAILSALAAALSGLFYRARARALSTKDTQLKNVVDQMPFGFLIEDEQRTVLYANERMLEVFNGTSGMPVSLVLGKDARQLADGVRGLVADYRAYVTRIEAIVRAHRPVFDEKIVLASGRTISRDYVPLLDEGRSIGGMWVYKDISEEENIDRAKTEFVSLASHQLRTPLTSIKWYAELLLEDAKELSETHQEYATEIAEASERMNGLVGALLDVSRLELGTFMIEPKPEDLVDILQTAADEQQQSFVKKKQTFTFTHPEGLPKVPVDRKLLFIIVQNLISNAHKYSPEGSSVKLSLERRTDGAYVITCSDTGYGIPKAQQARVFQKLFRADNIRVLDVEGTGLGLYIMKTIVDAAGSEISFVSEEGKGTTFTIVIPQTGMKAKVGTKTLGE